jgi:AraC family transcriptional regulator of adaptative response/methylated-DNA-[protein]-cysteine methyltransferase
MKTEAPADRHAAMVARACRRLDQEPADLRSLADDAGLSPHHFQRVFKRLTGLSPKAYADAARARRLQEELGKRGTITAAIYEAGFESSGRFYAASKKLLGMTAGKYRRGGEGEIIRFGVGQTSLGGLLVAATSVGICAVFLGDDPDALVDDLQQRFSSAELVGGDDGFEQWMARVAGWIDQPGAAWDLPLDLRGTAFQLRVWQALREIPPGRTATYAEIAAKLGCPSATRAVAGACAANKIAVAIPCHRVIRTGGGLSGYRWGIERKRELLRREAALP